MKDKTNEFLNEHSIRKDEEKNFWKKALSIELFLIYFIFSIIFGLLFFVCIPKIMYFAGSAWIEYISGSYWTGFNFLLQNDPFIFFVFLVIFLVPTLLALLAITIGPFINDEA